MHADASYLDGQYAAFGKMLDGFETLDEIARVRTNFNDRPLREQKMKSVTIED
jgi:peptidyl-prolyl cis-trans isomerase B (cyclophilin B)